MIVDDEPGVRALLRDTLSIAGFEVIEASDGMSALTLLRSNKPALMVIDINMPLMDGLNLLSGYALQMILLQFSCSLLAKTRVILLGV